MTSQGGLARHTSEGSNTGRFASGDWGLLGVVSLIWGSSFLWISFALEGLHPGAITFLRLSLGAAFLWASPMPKVKIEREWWPALLTIALAGNAGTVAFFALAQERVESSVAGMINSASPLLIFGVAMVMTRRSPGRLQLWGMAVGLVGTVFLAYPNLVGARAEPLGVLFAFVAVSGYSISNNLLPPLQQKFGGTAVIARALAIAAVVTLPYGVYGFSKSSLDWSAIAAVIFVAIVGTGLARSLFTNLIGRVGAPRASMVSYFVPLVAVVLGVVVRNEEVGPLELIGTGFILVGAFLISRAQRH